MASPNIFQSLLRPVKSVADYDADYDMAEGNKLKLAAARMGMEQSQRGAQQAEARRQAFAASGGNGKAYRNALQQIGDYAGVQEFDTQEQARAKGASDLDTADVARRKSEVEIVDKSLATAKTFANQIQTPQQAQAYLQGLYNDPVLGKVAERLMPYEQAVQQIPQDEAGLLRWKAGHMAITGDKLIDLLKPKTDITNMGGVQSFGSTDQFSGQRTQTGSAPILQSADNAASNARQAADAAAGRAVTIRGQNLSDAQAKMRDKTTRETAAAIIGKPLTEGQAKAVLFGARMEAANEILDGLEKKGVTASVPGSRAGYGIGAVITALSSSERQQLDQAKRDFINATLRRESGAVIADSEFDNAEKQYFPQIGDSKEVIAQKKRNREIAMRGIQAEVPEARKGMFREVQGVAPEAVPGGGFKYLGTE